MDGRGGFLILDRSTCDGQGAWAGSILFCASSVLVIEEGECFILLLPSDHCQEGVYYQSLGGAGYYVLVE